MVTVDEAISKGQRTVNYPVAAIIFITCGLALFLKTNDIIPTWLAGIGCGLGFLLGWLWWSFSITNWRIWAFENVRNVHELKKRAIQEKLIWPDSSLFEKTEVRNSNAKEKWNALQSKFNKEDEFLDNLTIPEETIIYYSKAKNYFEMLLGIALIGFGIWLMAMRDQYLLGAGMSLAGLCFAYKEFKEATNTSPQIILNQKGMQTVSTQFYPWNSIKNEEVVCEGSGKSMHYFLRYDHPEGTEDLEIDEYEINQKSLAEMLKVYRVRCRKNSR